MPFGGLLGSTFNFVFETQMENLQDGDRFYYLERTAGLNFLTELEGNSFAKLIMANTDATHLPGNVFHDADLDTRGRCQPSSTTIWMATACWKGATPSADSMLTPLVIRDAAHQLPPIHR